MFQFDNISIFLHVLRIEIKLTDDQHGYTCVMHLKINPKIFLLVCSTSPDFSCTMEKRSLLEMWIPGGL